MSLWRVMKKKEVQHAHTDTHTQTHVTSRFLLQYSTLFAFFFFLVFPSSASLLWNYHFLHHISASSWRRHFGVLGSSEHCILQSSIGAMCCLYRRRDVCCSWGSSVLGMQLWSAYLCSAQTEKSMGRGPTQAVRRASSCGAAEGAWGHSHLDAGEIQSWSQACGRIPCPSGGNT